MDKLNAVLDKLNPEVVPASVNLQYKIITDKRLAKEILQAVIDDRTSKLKEIEGYLVKLKREWGDSDYEETRKNIILLEAQHRIIWDEIKELQAAMGRLS